VKEDQKRLLAGQEASIYESTLIAYGDLVCEALDRYMI
jgi:hypothetical protein